MAVQIYRGHVMRQFVFAIQFRGRVTGDAPPRAHSIAPSSEIVSVIGEEGIACTIRPVAGESARFESEVHFIDESRGTFTESGSITFGDGRHRLFFSTIGQGFMIPGPEPGLKRGTVSWQVDRGEGQFEGATGLITANFTIGDAGEVTDNQFAVLYLP